MADSINTPITLDNKYTQTSGNVLMSGIQALVKLPMLQKIRDSAIGKNTAGFVSGYRGSPLSSYDQSLWKANKFLTEHDIVFRPGVNEELAATAIWGTQQLGYAPPGSNKFDGVFGIWYGKGPGVDRCSDVFKHANMSGTTEWGGVIAVAGDDHIAKSSSVAHQSDHIFKACGSPVFFPANVQEILDLGIHAFAMSRYAGVWAGMKTIQEIVESSSVVSVDPDRVKIIMPTDFIMPPGGIHIRWPDTPLEQESRLFDYKWYAALAYIRANKLNYNVYESPNDRFGIITSGKAYNDTRQALVDLGLDEDTCRRVGIRLHKVGVVWPLEAQLTREFATGLKEILVVEEKRQVIEYQLKEELYNWRSDVRPVVLGKFGESEGGEWSVPNPSSNSLLRANADLTPSIIARVIAQRLINMGVDADIVARMQAYLTMLDAIEMSMCKLELSKDAQRLPVFCSGCPHNTSTKVPDGSRAMAGIGCHYMSIWMDRGTYGFTQMGGEGVPWVGQQEFSNEKHIFANLGDGTYFHSGILAIRQSIAAGVNITYKILYNDAVAMTGGQPVGERPEGHTVVQIANSLKSEGVSDIIIVTDDPEKYDDIANLPNDINVEHRDKLDQIQKDFRKLSGTTIIIYDQGCATEKRRKRHRGTIAEPARIMVINPLVCEGCGDCGEQSSCMSIEPLETEFGRKRQINQSTCNKDFSCAKGFCPSFVTVEGGTIKKTTIPGNALILQDQIPLPVIPIIENNTWGIVVAGIGGTGVITIGQLLGMAAHLDGLGIVTQDAAGLAQKGGSTWSHILIGNKQEDIYTTRVCTASADLILGCDPIVTANKETLGRIHPTRTNVILNTHTAPTSDFLHQPNWKDPVIECIADLSKLTNTDKFEKFNITAVAIKLMGDSIFSNAMLLGFAWQKGWIPLTQESILNAITLNNVSVSGNHDAFKWGRYIANDANKVLNLISPQQVINFKPREKLESLISSRVEFLTNYQNKAYAAIYTEFVETVKNQEEASMGTKTQLTEIVVRNLFKLMAYKDEYEVARLHSDATFLNSIKQQFGNDIKLHYHLAPPILFNKKIKFGPVMGKVFKVLAKLKVIRGTIFDPFSYMTERKLEQQLIIDYITTVDILVAGLTPDNYAMALEIAKLPDSIKGFGHVKLKSLETVRVKWDTLLAKFQLL